MDVPYSFKAGDMAADSARNLIHSPGPFTKLLVTHVSADGAIDLTATEPPFRSWQDVRPVGLVHVEGESQHGPATTPRPSPALMYRFMLLRMTGTVDPSSNEWAELQRRVLAASEVADLPEDDQRLIIRGELSITSGASPLDPSIWATRDWATEDRILDDEGEMAFVHYPLPTSRKMPRVLGIPYIDEAGMVRANLQRGDEDISE